MELTEAGEVLLEEARAVLGGSERLEATVEELRRARTAGLRIGVPPGLPPKLLPGLLAPLREREPDAPIEVRELTTPDQLAALTDGTLDLGFVREPVDGKGLSRRTLLIEPLGASLPAHHALAARESVALRELAGERFVCFPRPWAPSLHDVLVSALRKRDITASFEDSAQLSTTIGHGRRRTRHHTGGKLPARRRARNRLAALERRSHRHPDRRRLACDEPLAASAHARRSAPGRRRGRLQLGNAQARDRVAYDQCDAISPRC